jgi:hypothetical protein
VNKERIRFLSFAPAPIFSDFEISAVWPMHNPLLGIRRLRHANDLMTHGLLRE